MTEYVYRYDGTCYSAGCDEFDNPLPYKGRREIYCHKYLIQKRTNCGVWIDAYGSRKFINLNAIKRWACPTEQEALISFIARKQRQIRILTSNLDDARTFLEKAKCLLPPPPSTSTPLTSTIPPPKSLSTASGDDITSSPTPNSTPSASSFVRSRD